MTIVYVDDNEMVPKNASVVVKRVPAKSAASSLISRINNLYGSRTQHPAVAAAQAQAEA